MSSKDMRKKILVITNQHGVTKKRERHPKVGVFLFFCAPHKTEPTCAMSVRADLQKTSDAQGVRIPRRVALEVLR